MHFYTLAVDLSVSSTKLHCIIVQQIIKTNRVYYWRFTCATSHSEYWNSKTLQLEVRKYLMVLLHYRYMFVLLNIRLNDIY